MGIPGLLKCLESITTQEHLREYKNMVAGIDASSWMYQGAYGCSSDVAQNIPTNKYVMYCLSRLELLKSYQVTPIMVFDGAPLPMKAAKNEERRSKRRHNRELGLAALAAGDGAAARKYFNQAIHITPGMVHKLIQALKKREVKFLVSPYEADAQLAFLSHSNLVDIVITEDSDALTFGCSKVLYKMDNDGNVQVIERRNLGANQGLSFLNWNHEMFLDMCLLAGCDYLPSITGIGIKTAHKIVKQYKKTEKILAAVEKIGYKLPSGYHELFMKARMTFLHQRVFDPVSEELTILNASEFRPLEGIQDYSFLGPEIGPDTTLHIVAGNLHPVNHTPLEDDSGGDMEIARSSKEEEEEWHQPLSSLQSVSPEYSSAYSQQQQKGHVSSILQLHEQHFDLERNLLTSSSCEPHGQGVSEYYLHQQRPHGEDQGWIEDTGADESISLANPIGKDLFSFFSRYPSNTTQVQVNNNLSEEYTSVLAFSNTEDSILSAANHQIVPIDADDFCSSNIGKNFQTLQRKKRKRGVQSNTDSSKTIPSFLKQLSLQRKHCGLEECPESSEPQTIALKQQRRQIQEDDKADFWSSFAHKNAVITADSSKQNSSPQEQKEIYAQNGDFSDANVFNNSTFVFENEGSEKDRTELCSNVGTTMINGHQEENEEEPTKGLQLGFADDNEEGQGTHEGAGGLLKFVSTTANVDRVCHRDINKSPCQSDSLPASRGLARFQVSTSTVKPSWKTTQEKGLSQPLQPKGEEYWDKKFSFN